MLVTLLLAAWLFAPAQEEEPVLRIGSRLQSLTVQEDSGEPKTVKLTEGKGTAVIVSDAAGCKAVGRANTLAALQRDYDGKGIRFVILNLNANRQNAKRLDAKFTPELFLFDEAGTLVYRGGVDGAGAAIDAVIGKESVKEPEVPVKDGCPIRY